jgi:hypothetical protein
LVFWPFGFRDSEFSAVPASFYGVDHTPSYLWDASTWEVSAALLQYLECVLSGPEAWREEPTIARAIQIRDGTVRNSKILSFQHREHDYLHLIRSSRNELLAPRAPPGEPPGRPSHDRLVRKAP